MCKTTSNKKKLPSLLLAIFLMVGLLGLQTTRAQVSSYYIFSQSSGSYTPVAATFPSTPADIYTTTWDDIGYSFPLPFAFTFNGTLYPAGTGYIGLDTDGWLIFSNGVPTMTGQTSGGSWVSISDHTGVYLWGSANFNGFAGLNCDLNNQNLATFTANVSSGSNVLTSVSSVANITVGTRLSGTGIPNGTVVISNTATTITMSANATSNSTGATITPSSGIYYVVTGTAPNRKLVIQWTQAKRYGATGTDNFNFQMILNEGGGSAINQTLQVVYGTFSSSTSDNLDAQVGLRGASSTDFNARKSTTGWATTTAATANTDIVRFNNTTVPASGLTFTWSPCTVAPGAAGAITGTSPVCPSTTQTYSLSAVPTATAYDWTYSGSGVTFTATTATPSNSFAFGAGATSGTITVTPRNLCGSGTASSLPITVSTITAATISYPAASYCTSASTVSVTQTGPSGGTYTSTPAGLSLNSSTGAITPASSSAGTYVITYTYTSGTCSGLTTTANMTINTGPGATASASPATICSVSNSQLTANSTSGSYSVNSISYSALTPSGSPTTLWSTYTDDATSSAISLPFTFTYYGNAITQVYVNTNGFIEMQTTAGTSGNTPQTLPSATTPNNIIAMAWEDLVIDPSTHPGCYIRYFTNGTSPNRVFVVDYYRLRFFGGTSSENVTGQIRLYESDNHIEVALGTVNDNGNNYTKTSGIENSGGTSGLSPSGRNNAAWNVTTSEAWSYTITNLSYSWSPATYLSATNIYNPVATNVAATTTYTVTVTNTITGCASTATTTVTMATPMSGTYTVGASGNYATLTAAVNAYNTNCIGGPIVFSLIDATYSASETFPIIVKRNSAASATNTLTIRPAAGVSPSISGTLSNNALIKIIGDYVTIDGSNNGTTTRNLTISNAGTTYPTVIHVGSKSSSVPVKNITLKNMNLNNGTNSSTSEATVMISDSATIGSPGYFNNITVQNNVIQKGYDGIDAIAVAASGNGSGTLITQNFVNSSGANAVKQLCIYLEGVDGGTVSLNNVGNTETASSEVDRGVWIASGCKNVVVEKNIIHDIRYTGTSGYAGHGIDVSTGNANANITIRNNMLYNFTGDGDSYTTYGAFYSPSAIYAYGNTPSVQTGINIYYNSIYLTGATINKASALSIGIALDDNNTAILKNNLVYNNLGRSGTTGIGATAVALENAVSQMVSGSNYNDYYVSISSGTAMIGRVASTNYSTLANWQTATAQEANSKNILPVFTSATDLHLVPASNLTLANAGSPISGLTEDYDGQTRNGLTPDIGCDEWVEPNKGSWVGPVSIDWMTAANWEANFIPDATTDVYITGGYSFMPTLTTTHAIRDLNLSAPGSPPILTINGGTLQVGRTINRTGGSIVASNGTLEMNGTAAQTIPANLFQSNTLKNLIISNTNNVTGVTLGGALDVYGSVTFSAAGLRLTTGDYLTFKSNASGTAWLGNVTGKTISGNATVERYIPTGTSHGKSWQLLAVPVSGTQTINQAWQDTAIASNQSRYSGFGTQLVSDISPLPSLFDAAGVAPSIKTYDAASNTWIGVANTTITPIANQKGYFVFVRGDRTVTTVGGTSVPTVLRTKGKLFTTGADAPPSTTVLANKYASIGNPYASAIDFLNISKPGSAFVDDAFIVWDPLRSGTWGYGGYQTISSTNGWKPLPGGTTNYPTGVAKTRIESGQAFLVHATGVSSGGTVSFAETSKSTGSNTVFRPGTNTRLNERQFLYTYLYGMPTAYTYLADASLVAVDDGFSNELTSDDALKMDNPGENISIWVGDKRMAIDAHAPLLVTDTVYYQLRNLKKQHYQFRFQPEKMTSIGMQAFLRDQYLQSDIPVSFTDSTIIDFDVTTDAASAAMDRFYLFFRPVTVVPVQWTRLSANRKGEHQVHVQWEVTAQQNVRLYEVQRSSNGRDFSTVGQLTALTGSGQLSYQQEDYRAPNTNLYYRIRSVDIDGRYQFSSIATVGPWHAQPGFAIVPNPVVGQFIHLEGHQIPAGSYAIRLSNKIGQIVWQDRLVTDGSQTQWNLELKQPLAAGSYQLQIESADGQQYIIHLTMQL